MESKISIVVADGCPACQYLKKIIAEKNVKVDLIDIGTDAGFDFIKKHNITAVPKCIVVVNDEQGERVRECNDEELMKIFKGQS